MKSHSTAISAIERELIADIARVAAIAPTVPSNYLSQCEYESRGGRFTREQIKRLGRWMRYHALSRGLVPPVRKRRDPAPVDAATADAMKAQAAQEIIDDILLICRRQGWPQGARPSFKEYWQLGGLHPIHNIRCAGGWRKLCARAGLGALRAKLERATADLATIVADARKVARSLGRGEGETLTSIEYREFGGRYYAAACAGAGGWAKVCAAAGLALPRQKAQKHRLRRKWQKSSGVWCGAVELTPSQLTGTEATSASDPSALPAEPAVALNLVPTAGQIFVRGTFDPDYRRMRQIKRQSSYYRTRLAAIASKAADR